MDEKDIYILTDEDGNERKYKLLDELEEKGTIYYALAPYAANPAELLESDRGIYVIVKCSQKDGIDYFESLEEEEEERIGLLFDERSDDWEDEEDSEETEI